MTRAAYTVQWPPKTLKGWLMVIGGVVIGGAVALVFGVVLLAVLGVLLLAAPFLLWWARRRVRKAHDELAEQMPPRPDGPRVIDVEAEVGPPTE